MIREYPGRPFVGIGVVVLRPPAVLLVRRGRPPALGSWSLPGGAQELGETAEAAARRELHEETGLRVGALHLLGHADSIHYGPDGRVQYHYTILDFAAAWIVGEPVAAADATTASFVHFDTVGCLGLSHDVSRMIALARETFSFGGDAS